MMTYCSKYALLTPRNGRRKFRSPVQIPSMVLQCTSRTPSPSSSRANSPRLWFTVACPRPRRPSGVYPFQSSVYTIAPGSVAGRTVASTSSADPHRCPTRNHTRPLRRPTIPGTGGRSVSQVPWPLAWFARRRGGSSGSVCGTPFFPQRPDTRLETRRKSRFRKLLTGLHLRKTCRRKPFPGNSLQHLQKNLGILAVCRAVVFFDPETPTPAAPPQPGFLLSHRVSDLTSFCPMLWFLVFPCPRPLHPSPRSG